jgi:predicted HicB family RNase H-like nuclease
MADKKQITTRIPSELHRKVKAKAALEDKTITKVIENLLSDWVKDDEQAQADSAQTN